MDLGDGVKISYNQNEAVEMTQTVLEENDWETQREPIYDQFGVVTDSQNKQPIDTEGNCFYQAGVMVSNSGATSLGGEVNNINGTDEILQYTGSQINQGYSVRFHVDYNNNGSGDHWVAVSSVIINLRTGVIASINYFDPGTVHSDLGTNATNRLAVRNGILTGTAAYNSKTYNVIAVRKNLR